jgi:hypothetical protein
VDEAEKFWSDFEAQTNEKVVARAMGIWHEKGEEKGPWGLVILTDKTFRFKYMPSESLLMGLFRPPEGKGAKREAVDIVAPLDRIAALAEEKKGRLSRLFGSPFRRFEIAWDDSSGAERRRESFSVDPSGDLLEKLRRSLPGLAG